MTLEQSDKESRCTESESADGESTKQSEESEEESRCSESESAEDEGSETEMEDPEPGGNLMDVI